jgi:hypothetical protein
MPDDSFVWKDQINGVRVRIDMETALGRKDIVMISRWCSQTEDFVASCTCDVGDVGIVLERMTKLPPQSVTELQDHDGAPGESEGLRIKKA